MDEGLISVETLPTVWSPRCSVASSSRRPNLLLSRVAAGCAAVVLHLLALAMVVGPHQVRHDSKTAGVPKPGIGHWIEPLPLVEVDDIARGESRWPELPALAALRLPGELPLTIPDLPLMMTDRGEVESTDASERMVEPVPVPGTDPGELFARYIAQIKARVERAWERPDHTTGLLAAEPSCIVDVKQDESGVVLEVKVHRCAADTAWRSSLLTAVRRASPLPAAPATQVFAENVRIAFGPSSDR